ncbi:MAG TPA: type II secretion system F family protein [Candidatus Paceibacterota bacterium]
MARFTYTAEKDGGEVYRGATDAHDRFELYQIVRQEGGKIIAMEEDRSTTVWSLAYWNAFISSVSEQQKILFTRNLGAMLSAGLSLARALSVIERQTRNPKLSKVITSVAGSVRHGDPLHEALAQFPRIFSPLVVAMVRAGEESGELPNSLQVIAEQMERMHTLKKKVRSALIYPTIVVVAIVGIGVLMMIEVVPTLAQTFKEMNVDLPASTQSIIALSNFLVEYTFVAIILFLGSVSGVYLGLRTKIGKRIADKTFLTAPLIGTIVREVNSARTARTLSSLLSAGVAVLQALEISGEVVQNSYFRDVLKDAIRDVSAGEALSKTFGKNEALYPAFVGEMIAVGEETGHLADMLKRLAEYYESEVDRKTKDLSTVIEPFLMVAIGAAVGFFAVSMISPIYSLSQNI